ncbi:MAG TPA: sulfatase [Acidobacteriota bacterium]
MSSRDWMNKTPTAWRAGVWPALALIGLLWPWPIPRRAAPAPPPPNILLITIDTLRQDHCSAYGYERETTPALSRFADQGTKFDLAYAPMATTAPTHATIFTAHYPISHRVIKNGLMLAPKLDTLAELLRASGYQTAGIVSSFVLETKSGLAQGFELYDDQFTLEGSTSRPRFWVRPGGFDRRADVTTERVIRWLAEERRPDRPFFLFVHYFDPHEPYVPPQPFAARFAPAGRPSSKLELDLSRYDAEIAFTDSQIAVLLESLRISGLEHDTVIAITADHGEGLMQHGHMGHGVHIYEESVRVPLLMRWPGKIGAGRIISEPVELVDLAPTLLDLARLPYDPGRFQGRSLAASLLDGDPLEPTRPIYLHRRPYRGERIAGAWFQGERFAVRLGNWKLLERSEDSKDELYDLANDPEEQTNLYAADSTEAQSLATLLGAWKQASGADGAALELSEEDLARLRALGYTQ